MMSVAPIKPGIYKIAAPSGNFYIGSAINIRRRWHEHKTGLRSGNHHNKPLQSAHAKYGLEFLEFSVVEFCDEGSLIEKEQHYINTLKPTYNTQKTAGSCLGMKYSEETKEKVRLAATNISEETRLKRSAAAKAQWADKEARKKISDAIKFAANSENTKEKLRIINTGKKMSEDSKEKMRNAKLGKILSDDTKNKISKSQTGKIRSAETRLKMSLAKRGVK